MLWVTSGLGTVLPLKAWLAFSWKSLVYPLQKKQLETFIKDKWGRATSTKVLLINTFHKSEKPSSEILQASRYHTGTFKPIKNSVRRQSLLVRHTWQDLETWNLKYQGPESTQIWLIHKFQMTNDCKLDKHRQKRKLKTWQILFSRSAHF